MKPSVFQLEPNGLVPDLIHPNQGQKFSPNLYRYLMSNKAARLYGRVYRDEDENLWLGYRHERDFIGLRLITALCQGAATSSASYAVRLFVTFDEVPDFWERYTKDGRCAIDTEHRQSFQGDQHRYAVAPDGETRTCQWCGYRQQARRWTVTIDRLAWDPVTTA